MLTYYLVIPNFLQYSLTSVSTPFSIKERMKINPRRVTQAAADRVYKLRDTEETPSLLLLAQGHFTAMSPVFGSIKRHGRFTPGGTFCSRVKDVANK